MIAISRAVPSSTGSCRMREPDVGSISGAVIPSPRSGNARSLYFSTSLEFSTIHCMASASVEKPSIRRS
jgi:hypothetical protein